MYRAKIVKILWNVEREEWERILPLSHFSKEHEKLAQIACFQSIELPFAPYVGLQIYGETWESGPIESVEWHIERKEFICRVAPEFPGRIGEQYDSLDDLKSRYDNWQVAKGRQ